MNLLPLPPSSDVRVPVNFEAPYEPQKEPYPLKNGAYDKENVVSYDARGTTMPRIPLSLFAQFYEARPAAQVRIVRDIRTRMLNPREYRRRYHYLALRNYMDHTHWAPQCIEPFQNGFEYFLSNEKADKRELFRKLGNQYVSFWQDMQGSYFPVPPVDVAMDDLVVMVRPEIGMLSHGDRMVLKIWFNMTAPTRQTRQVIHHFMERARDESDGWSDGWNVGLLDIPRKRIPAPLRPARDFRLGLEGQVSAFLRLWESLEAEARRTEEEGPLS